MSTNTANITTKKELKRYTKLELQKTLKDNNITFNNKSKKNDLVELVFSNENLLKTLVLKPKRIPTEKQLAAREQFAERAREKSRKLKEIRLLALEKSEETHIPENPSITNIPPTPVSTNTKNVNVSKPRKRKLKTITLSS